MVGRPSKKIQCEAKRKYDGQQCEAKGILKNNGRYICKLHGGMSYGQKTIDGKIKALMNLKQNKNKTYEEIKRNIQPHY
tara:strand:- start:538 stop:774 length:237 start_codon:yes stop_codon:yes gene_type:complete